MTNKLNFVAVGPFKTGTSWIHDYLLNYQQVALPTKVKETFFFDRKFERGLDWYYSHFTNMEENKIVGEIAPSYFHSPEATQRIYKLNPQCQILVTLREPVSRLFSFYSHMNQRGELKPGTSFTQALSNKKILLNTSLYYSHLSRWIEVFGRENVKIVFFERLKQSPELFAEEVLNKLDIEKENITYDLSKKVNASQAPVNHQVSKLVYSGVKLLHNTGLHKVVEYGKRLGIRQLITTKEKQKSQLSQAEFVDAFELCKQNILLLESELNLDLFPWKAIWSERGITIN